MSIRVVTGLPHNGKGIWLADRLFYVLARNKRWFKKTGTKRKITTIRFKLNENFVRRNSDFIQQFDNEEVLPELWGTDVFIDEMGIPFDSTRWADLDPNIKAWLYAHEHLGCEIYGASQDFAQIDIAVRRLTSRLQYATKTIGSPRPHVTKIPVKHPWGLIRFNTVPRIEYTKPANEYSDHTMALFAGEFIFIRKKYTSLYDTTQEFEGANQRPLNQIERECVECGVKKLIHV